jgi:gamma-glutamylcysteine synthetase
MATDFAAVHAATDDFLARFPFSDQVRDDEGNIYRATDPNTGDELSFDCSYNTLEISFGPDENLNKTHRLFTAYYTALQEALAKSSACRRRTDTNTSTTRKTTALCT